MKVGLISDTHGYLDPNVATYFADCDEIWHAGDIGEPSCLPKLQEIAPTFAVWGNIDTRDQQTLLPENLFLTREGLVFLITHIAGSPKRFRKEVTQLLNNRKTDVLICGHSHIVKVIKTPLALYVNPGAAGKQGFHKVRTIMKMTLQNKKITNLELIELGKR